LWSDRGGLDKARIRRLLRRRGRLLLGSADGEPQHEGQAWWWETRQKIASSKFFVLYLF
jgi:hypothetical protein